MWSEYELEIQKEQKTKESIKYIVYIGILILLAYLISFGMLSIIIFSITKFMNTVIFIASMFGAIILMIPMTILLMIILIEGSE
ncbi:MAG: hypothetical protein ACXACO_11645 [Promethearchaeota archaeon]|jgi:hypothetical protein